MVIGRFLETLLSYMLTFLVLGEGLYVWELKKEQQLKINTLNDYVFAAMAHLNC